MTSSPEPPEVRQCQDPESYLFGASAVAVGDGRWGVMTTDRGGHYADDTEVDGWPVLSAPAKKAG